MPKPRTREPRPARRQSLSTAAAGSAVGSLWGLAMLAMLGGNQSAPWMVGIIITTAAMTAGWCTRTRRGSADADS